MRSPGASVAMFDAYEIRSRTVWTISAVLASCITLPFRVYFTARFCGSPTNWAGTMKGPLGPNVS